jgi:ribosomal protein L13
VLTGKKFEEKIYYRHSGSHRLPANVYSCLEHAKYGGSAEILWKAVNGMLPKNKLRIV